MWFPVTAGFNAPSLGHSVSWGFVGKMGVNGLCCACLRRALATSAVRRCVSDGLSGLLAQNTHDASPHAFSAH